MTHIDRIPEDNRTDEARAVAADADKYGALYALSTSAGGKVLIEGLRSDVRSIVDRITTKYVMLQEIELREACARLSITLDLIRSLTHSKDNLAGAVEALDELAT